MHFLIATAALLSAATLATASPIDPIELNFNPFFKITAPTGPPPEKVSCRIIGDAEVIVRDCPSRDCDEMARYKPGQMVDFYCYFIGTEVNNPHDKITNAWWDYSKDGFFPDVYIEQTCADKVTKLCKVCI